MRHRHALPVIQRERIASEAARVMAVDGVRDFRQAKLKAVERLGLSRDVELPRNAEVDLKLREYQRLFQGEQQPAALKQKREAAVEAMVFFHAFEPRLVGAVLDGTADARSPIELQVFSDAVEPVEWFLTEQQIPFDAVSRRVRVNRDTDLHATAFEFNADSERIEVLVLPLNLLRQAPVGRFDDKPMERANLRALRELLARDDYFK
jgi:hypothetical protein